MIQNKCKRFGSNNRQNLSVMAAIEVGGNSTIKAGCKYRTNEKPLHKKQQAFV